MKDTTIHILSDPQLQAIIDAANSQPPTTNPGWMIVLGATIAAVAGLLGQLAAPWLTQRRAKKEALRKVIADERRIAHLLRIQCKLYTVNYVRAKFHEKLSKIHPNKEEANHLWNEATRFVELWKEADIRFHEIIADYVGLITGYLVESKSNNVRNALKEFNSFTPPLCRGFENLATVDEVEQAFDNERKKIMSAFSPLIQKCNRVSKELSKDIGLKWEEESDQPKEPS